MTPVALSRRPVCLSDDEQKGIPLGQLAQGAGQAGGMVAGLCNEGHRVVWTCHDLAPQRGLPPSWFQALQFARLKDELMRDALAFSPMAWPMLIPPRDWSPIAAGGYLTNEVMKATKWSVGAMAH
jgi:hypothetical protein